MTNKIKIDTYHFDKLPKIAGTQIALGGFSGLVYEGINPKNGQMSFLTHTDRGPNSEQEIHNGLASRRFALPDFQPRWVRFELDPIQKTAHVVQEILLSDTSGKALTGRPNTNPQTNTTDIDEVPLTLEGRPLPFNRSGIDPEGIAKDRNGNFWMIEEYRPSFLKFSPAGKLLARFVPHGSDTKNTPGAKEALPKTLRERQMNRGFEGLAIEGDHLYAFLQSPLESEVKNSLEASIIEFNIQSEAFTHEYTYTFDGKEADKIGDATSLGNKKFLVIEQNSKTNHKSFRKVFEITLGKNSKDIQKRLLVDLTALGFGDIEKFEGLALIDAQRIAVLNDNDFAFAGPSPTLLGVIHLPVPLF